MATVELQGTTFSVDCLPAKLFWGEWVRIRVSIKNEYTDYCDDSRVLLFEDFEEWVFGMRRFLAGAYKSEHNLQFENAGLAVDFYPYQKNGAEPTRDELRDNDCVMAVRLLMRAADKNAFLGGVYTLLLHRADINVLSKKLLQELEENYPKRVHGRGKFVFVGVSPLGYDGCNYWYLDKSKQVKAGDFVWVKMGRHNTEQIVRVDSVRRYTELNVPYNPERVKQVLRIATEQEIYCLFAPHPSTIEKPF